MRTKLRMAPISVYSSHTDWLVVSDIEGMSRIINSILTLINVHSVSVILLVRIQMVDNKQYNSNIFSTRHIWFAKTHPKT